MKVMETKVVSDMVAVLMIWRTVEKDGVKKTVLNAKSL